MIEHLIQSRVSGVMRRKMARAGFGCDLLPVASVGVREKSVVVGVAGAVQDNGTHPAGIEVLPGAREVEGKRRSGAITIVLADDHQVMRQGLRSLFKGEVDFQVVGEAGDGIETIRMVESLRPNVLVMDLMMDSINGLEVTRQLCERCPGTSVVILSTQSNEAYVAEALRAGAKAYVLKESSFEELVQAIRKSATGQHFLSLALSERVIEVYLKKRDAPLDPYETLTTREREVLLLAAHGQSNAKIAERLVISRRTVEVHRAKMMHKLNLANQIELVRFALQRGMLG